MDISSDARAAQELSEICAALASDEISTEEKRGYLVRVVEAFEEEEHDLSVYTQLSSQEGSDKWGDAEELFHASSDVYNITRQLLRGA